MYSAMPSTNQSGGLHRDHAWSAGAAPPAREDVALELVRHLVREDVVDVGVRPRQRHDVALLEEVGEAAGPLPTIAGVVVVCWKSAGLA